MCTACDAGPANSTSSCNGTSCGFTCNAGYHSCNNNTACLSNTSVNSCGSGCAPCSGPPSGHGQATCSSNSCGVSCDSGYGLCSNDCVLLTTDANNCGTCGHGCGPGATCSGGKCQAVALAANLSAPNGLQGLDVSPDGVYFTASGGVFSCGLTSCPATGPQQIGGGFGQTFAVVVTRGLSPNLVAFDGTPAEPGPSDFLYTCPVGGCATTVPSVTAWGGKSQSGLGTITALAGSVYYLTEGTGGSRISRCSGAGISTCTQLTSPGGLASDTYNFAVDANNLYYFAPSSTTSSYDDLVACSTATTPCTVSAPLATAVFLPGKVTAYGGNVYWWAGKSADPLLACAATGCSNSPTTIVKPVDGVSELFVDASGVYWINTTGVLNKCPLTGCPGTGPTIITSGISGAKFLKVQGTSAYWLGTSAVYRIAL